MQRYAIALLLVGCGGDDAANKEASNASFDDSATSIAPTTSGSTASSGSPSGADGSSGDADSTGGAGLVEVEVETSLGAFVVGLDDELAPITVANFLAYVDAGFYDGTDGAGPTLIHRVQPGRLLQGGGHTEDLMEKPTMAPIESEADNGLVNVRGAIGMARIPDDIDSATSQFYVNLVDNPELDMPPGFAVFGRIVEGMDTIDAMAMVETTSVGPLDDVPVDPIIITTVRVRDP